MSFEDESLKITLMKKMNFILSISMLILMITAIGCKKDEKSSIGFSMKAVDSNAPAQTSQQSGQNPDDEGPVNDEHLALAWDVAWIYITQIQFSAELISLHLSRRLKEILMFITNGRATKR